MSKVLIVGKGGREHALGWNIEKDEDVEIVFYAPGNAGTNSEKSLNININGTKKENFHALLNFVEKENIELVVVGPEAPLNDGIVDYFNSYSYFNIFGPTKEKTKLEADKFYSYDLMKELGIPQARSIKCYNQKDGLEAIRKFSGAVVLKHRGLAEGKGVRVYDSRQEAKMDLGNFLEKFPGDFLVADRLYGEEFSFFGIADGSIFVPINLAIQDHKRVNDGDKGLNTGGMGAYCPAPVASERELEKIAREIMSPVVEKIRYKGFLYAGMIKSKEDSMKVIEFNCRLGDPETQTMVMMLEDSLYKPLLNSVNGNKPLEKVSKDENEPLENEPLKKVVENKNSHTSDFNKSKVPKDSKTEDEIRIKSGASCCVVLASRGYPKMYQKGFPIHGIEKAEALDHSGNIKIFHADTKLNENNEIVSDGGRVLGVTAYSPEGIPNAKMKAYGAVDIILGETPGVFHCRRDISDKALRYLGR
ncbi:MAG: phosphoribosylamine--glycine ligase [Nanoarchaeota archaeon]